MGIFSPGISLYIDNELVWTDKKLQLNFFTTSLGQLCLQFRKIHKKHMEFIYLEFLLCFYNELSTVQLTNITLWACRFTYMYIKKL